MKKTTKRTEGDRLGERIFSALKQRKDVLGIVLAGSRAVGAGDEFSDFDIHVLLSRTNSLKNEIENVFKNVDGVLFSFEPHFLSDFVVFYLGDGHKFDICFYHEHSQLAKITDKRVRIIKDTVEGDLKRVLGDRKLDVSPSSIKEKFLGLALADLFAVARECFRRDLFKARFNLDEAREMIANYINYEKGHFRTGFDKFSSLSPKPINKLMEKSLKGNDTFEGIRIAALRLVAAIEKLKFFDKKAIRVVKSRLTDK